jgi:ATP-binding cassette subfamily A (ABC1) protein 3
MSEPASASPSPLAPPPSTSTTAIEHHHKLIAELKNLFEDANKTEEDFQDLLEPDGGGLRQRDVNNILGPGVGGSRVVDSFASQSQIDDEDPWAYLPKSLKNKKKVAYMRTHSDLKTPSRTCKFNLLLWKDWTTLKRCWKSTLIEMLTPVLAVALLTISISFWPEQKRLASTYTSFGVQPPYHVFKNCSKFVFAPNIPLVKDIMTGVQLEFQDGFKKHSFELVDGDFELTHMRQSELCAGIVFTFKPIELLTHLTQFPQNIHFKIRLPAVPQGSDLPESNRLKSWAGGMIERGSEWQTSYIYPVRLLTGPRNEHDYTGGSPGYYQEGFLLLQHLVSKQILHWIYMDGMKKTTSLEEAEDSFNKRMGNIVVQLNRFPYPSNKDNSIVKVIHDMLPVIIVVAYMIPFMLMVYGCVLEKESGIRVK